jgi:hypothetical protein
LVRSFVGVCAILGNWGGALVLEHWRRGDRGGMGGETYMMITTARMIRTTRTIMIGRITRLKKLGFWGAAAAWPVGVAVGLVHWLGMC